MKMNKKIFTDGERGTRWGLEETSIEILEKANVPYCFNPQNKKAIVLFDDRVRSSTVVNTYKCLNLPQNIRSKYATLTFLESEEDDEAPLQFGFGLTLGRLNGESIRTVEIARIIVELQFDSLKDLSDYLFFERPELFNELSTKYNFFAKFMNDFKSTNQLKEINESVKALNGTIKNGFDSISQSNKQNNDK